MTDTPERTGERRPDNFAVRFIVIHHLYDTNVAGTGYDLVGVDVTCKECGEELPNLDAMAGHARSHEPPSSR